MDTNPNFAIVGGDRRQLFLAKSLLSDKRDVKIYGFDAVNTEEAPLNFSSGSWEEGVKDSKYVILPLPVTKDCKTINAPFAKKPIKIDDKIIDLLKNKIVFCGNASALYNINSKFNKLNIKNYSIREDFQIMNAVPSAEGALQIAMSEFNGTINGAKCLVAGYGRIGKVLSALLKNMGANVTVSARSSCDLAWIKCMHYKCINTSDIHTEFGYHIIFNTIPAMIFNKNVLLKCRKNSLIIDVSSKPGGVDFEVAKDLGIRAIHALGLPGKFSPMSAAEIIKNTIYNIIKEENL